MTEAGPLDLIDHSDDENDGKNLSLPGVRKGKDFYSQTTIHSVQCYIISSFIDWAITIVFILLFFQAVRFRKLFLQVI